MSRAWGILPLTADESDVMMFVLVLFILAVLVISLFMTFPVHVALFFSGAIVVSLGLAIHETRRLTRIETESDDE